MKICKLCKKNVATKTNSHLITWALIKESVNQRGFKDRGHEIVFSISSFNTSKVHIGRSVLPETIEDVLGYSTSENEGIQNEDSLVRDYIFCPTCESAIGKIENEFVNRIYSKIEKVNDENLPMDSKSNKVFSISSFESKITLLLAYSIFFRTSIVFFNNFSLDFAMEEEIRLLLLSILANDSKQLEINIQNINFNNFKFPLLVSYLQTHDSDENIIVQNHSDKPFFIWANRIVIQLYKKQKHISSSTNYFYGFSQLINPKDYYPYNVLEGINICIISDEKRKQLIKSARQEMATVKMNFLLKIFNIATVKFIKRKPTLQERNLFASNFAYFNANENYKGHRLIFIKAFNATFNLESPFNYEKG